MGKIIDEAVRIAISIANNDGKHGYDQINRYGTEEDGDFDCSSLVIYCFDKAGIPVKKAGATYTGNMLSAFKKCGFIEVPLKDRKKGDVLLNKKYHTALCIDHDTIVNASIGETGKATGNKKGDQTGKEISVRPYYDYSKGWDVVLRYPEADDVKEPVKPQQTENTVYTVVAGDTLTKIAKKYGVSIDDIASVNGIKNKNLIKVGQKLVIPSKGASITTSKPVQSIKVGKVVTKYENLNVRSGQSMDSKIVGELIRGRSYEFSETSGNWYKLADGRGYVSAKFIQL